MKAVVLAGGESLKQYSEGDFQDAFIIAVNSTPLKLDKGARIDLCMVQDTHRTALKNNPAFFSLDKSIPLQFIAGDWQAYADKRGNATIMQSRPHTYDKNKIGGAICAHGNTTAVSAVLEALRRGYTEVYLFGHDCSAGHSLHQDGLIQKTIKELNFAHSVAVAKVGAVYISADSYLCKYNAVDSQELLLKRYTPTEKSIVESVPATVKKARSRKKNSV